jgi:hypothetical protein
LAAEQGAGAAGAEKKAGCYNFRKKGTNAKHPRKKNIDFIF